ncbi:MAG: hypothetical protein K0Q49_2229, partial [Haloplasmataceae bacterium]|nr:hypothetical protein [Haloplasmataceae bacterium]
MKRINFKILLMGLDLVLVVSMYLLTPLLTKDYDSVRFSITVFKPDILDILKNLYWILPIYWFSFYFFKLYSSLWRYASVEEAINVFFAIVSSSALVALFKPLFKSELQVNEIIIANLLLFLILVGIRYSYR